MNDLKQFAEVLFYLEFLIGTEKVIHFLYFFPNTQIVL